MSKMMLHDEAAREALGRGVAKLARAVRGTLGPKGMNAIMDRPIGTPIISRDGVSIASEIELECPFENMGAQVLREVSKQTNEVAGDGTTTATVLADVLVQDGLRRLAAGANAVELVEGLELAVKATIDALKHSAIALQGPAGLRAGGTSRHCRRRIWQHRSDDPGSHRRHGLRARLPLASHGDRCGEDAGRSRQSVHSDDRPQDPDW